METPKVLCEDLSTSKSQDKMNKDVNIPCPKIKLPEFSQSQ